ncbi:MAG TPA: carboxylating nicotinate-nucleotide diphosphorylase [Armatimonadota bacterium]|jgi:nicotinate-nucleotide pyrophosphorylase (carboxylating)
MTPDMLDAALVRSVYPLIDLALAEDLGTGDITSATTIPADAEGDAVLVAKESGILAGLPVAALVMRRVDPRLRFTALVEDGRPISPGEQLAEMHGPVRSLLTAERTALNFLQRLSGIATTTSRYVQAVAGTQARIVDTRKTIPGHRVLDKYAVRVGGGSNHRFNLSDGVLIKDNHILAIGGITAAIHAARAGAPHTLKIEVEVETLEMAQHALDAGADIIMLDNMTPEQMRACVDLIAGRALTEASGGVTLDRVRAIAESGVDLISVGALTHSVRALDISLDFIA